MKKNIYLLLFFSLIITSCGSSKDILYLQDVDLIKKQQIDQKIETVIQVKDLLSISVYSRNPELTQPFNLTNSQQQGTTQSGYTVDENGNIDFPVLGKIPVVGLTRIKLQEDIKQRLINANLIKDPTVNVQLLNFRIFMLGEVGKPGEIQVTGDRITIFEALSMSGDITIHGRKDRVAIIRETGNTRTVLFNDIRTTEIFNSPYFYLQLNDLGYVEPNKTKQLTNARANMGMIMSFSSFILSISSFALIFFK